MKGLCFGCNEPYDRHHKCAKRQVYSLLVELAEDEQGRLEVGRAKPDTSEEDVLVTLHALRGELGEGDNNRTMKLKGSFKKKRLNILVDSGSTHNFLDLGMIKGMNLNMVTVPPVKVTVADGRCLVCRSMLRHFTWEMQGQLFTADFYVITLGGCEVILGVKWLATLGDIVWNFQISVMKFCWDGMEVILQGELGRDDDPLLQMTTILRHWKHSVIQSK
ncbi:hypothetical protein MLD38_034667 [Melastoma candidum]|uniref:Uncharacterized protein n=1 Tax=Melastoma candidum TaxID=119954 RepID=A0ACB9MAE2_9MYRT|nr:hypothetical protein MLD38_034667 [Melastoma candidum]